MPTFRTKSTLGHDPLPIIFTWPDLSPDRVHFIKFGPKLGSDNAHFDECSIKCCIDGALFVDDLLCMIYGPGHALLAYLCLLAATKLGNLKVADHHCVMASGCCDSSMLCVIRPFNVFAL